MRKHYCIPRTLLSCLIIGLSFCGAVGRWCHAEDLQAIRDPYFIVNVWEEEFRQQSYFDPTGAATEKAYANLLEKVKNYLRERGVAAEIMVDHRLLIKPLPQQDPHHLNQVAQEIAQAGISFEYWPPKYLFKLYKKDSLIFMRQTPYKWYFNGNTLQNLSYLFGKNIFKQNIDLIRHQNFDPLVTRVFQDYLFGHKHYQSLTVTPHHPLPYFAIMLNEAQNIYIPRIHDRQQYIVPGTLAFNNYRASQKLSAFAQDVLRKLDHQDPATASDFRKLQSFYFCLIDTLSAHIINLNAVIYLLLEMPQRVFFLPDREFADKMCVFINPRRDRDSMAYFLNIPWPSAILERGRTAPLLASPEFQLFYRYHLDLYDRLLAITPLVRISSTDPRPFLQALIDLGKTSPNDLSITVQDNPWNFRQLRFFMQKSQDTAIKNLTESLKKFKHSHKKKKKKKLMQDCAKNLLPPDHPA